MVEVERLFSVSNIESRGPAQSIELCDVGFRIYFRVGQGRGDGNRDGPRPRRGDWEANLAEFQGLGDCLIGLVIHSGRLRRASPVNEVVVLSQPLSGTKVDLPLLMHSRADLNLRL